MTHFSAGRSPFNAVFQSFLFLLTSCLYCRAADKLDILSYADPGTMVDQTGHLDASASLSRAVKAANFLTSHGQPVCVYVPAGIYLIKTAPPMFKRAGCLIGDGPAQSIFKLDAQFQGDLFGWSEAWAITNSGPKVAEIGIHGSLETKLNQNGLMFYDRNDNVQINNVEVDDVTGHGLAFGIRRFSSQAYIRESRLNGMRLFNDGRLGASAFDLSSEGRGRIDATNEIRISQLDIYAARGPALVIHNNGDGVIRNVTISDLRVEGSEKGDEVGDLVLIGDTVMTGAINNISLTNTELIDPASGFAALRITTPPNAPLFYNISMSGFIGGGLPKGQGLVIDSAFACFFNFSSIHTEDTNIVVKGRVSKVLLNGYGQENTWTYRVDSNSTGALLSPKIDVLKGSLSPQ